MSDVPCKERFYEDFSVGEFFEFSSTHITEEQMVDFATQFDPQRFHIDAEAASETIYGALIASGWHTGSLMMKLLAQDFLGTHSVGAAGLSELSWPNPVYANDQLTLTVEILSKRRSNSKPNLGLIEIRNQLVNQNGLVALQAVPTMLISTREQSAH